MMKKHAFILFIICGLSSICPAYELVGTEELSKELVARHYSINPNLDAVIVVDRTISTFEYHTYYGAGSADEEEGKQGRLHFLEHIISGTGSHEYGQLRRIINENGGQSNAFTTSHFTYFVMRFPKDKFDLAVEIDRDRYYDTVINEEVVEKEKRIVLTEISHRRSDLQRIFSNRFWGLVYGKKNFNGLGTEDFIKQIESVGLKAYHENFLRRQKRLVVVIGDVDVAHVLTKLDEAYGNEQISGELSDELPSPHYPDPEILGKKEKLASNSLSIAKFWKSWQTSHLGHRDYATLLILARILDKSSNSLRSYIVDSGLTKVFRVSLYYNKGFSLLSCTADLPTDASIDAIENAIEKELEKIKAHGVSEDDFAAARNLQLKSMYFGFYDRSGMANEFGRAFAYANDPLLYPKLIKDLKSVRRDDIPRLIDQYLTHGNSITLSLTLPPKEISSSQEKTSFRTLLYYAFILWALAGFGSLLIALLVWGVKKRRGKFSEEANEYVSESDA